MLMFKHILIILTEYFDNFECHKSQTPSRVYVQVPKSTYRFTLKMTKIQRVTCHLRSCYNICRGNKRKKCTPPLYCIPQTTPLITFTHVIIIYVVRTTLRIIILYYAWGRRFTFKKGLYNFYLV